MSFAQLCDISEIAQALGLPFPRALALYNDLNGDAKPEPQLVIVRRHEGTIGELSIVI